MIVIRRAEFADAAQLQRAYASTNTYSGTLLLPHPSLEMWRERLKQSDQNNSALVAMVVGAVVGHAGLHQKKNSRRCHVASLGIGVADTFVGLLDTLYCRN